MDSPKVDEHAHQIIEFQGAGETVEDHAQEVARGHRILAARQILQGVAPAAYCVGGRRAGAALPPLVESAEPGTARILPDCEPGFGIQQVAQARLEAMAVGILAAQVLMTGMIGGDRGIAGKGPDVVGRRAIPHVPEAREQLHHYVGGDVFHVLRLSLPLKGKFVPDYLADTGQRVVDHQFPEQRFGTFLIGTLHVVPQQIIDQTGSHRFGLMTVSGTSVSSYSALFSACSGLVK